MCRSKERGTPWRRVRTLSPRPRRRYFADLADAQTINNDKKGSWKAPLWQALTEAGLPLSWVAGGLRRLRRQHRRRFSRAERRRAFCRRRAARRNHAGGMAIVAGENPLARWRDDGCARKPERPHRAQCRRHIIRSRARRPLCQGGRTYRRARRAAPSGLSIALVDAAECRIEAGLNLAGDPSDTVTLANVQPIAIKPAPKGFDQTTLMLMGGVARSLQIAGALESMLDISVRYSNERVAFEKKISKFQAVQHNLARLAGESAAALAAATSAADAIANATSFDDEVFLEAASAKIRCSEAAEKGAAHRPSGPRRDRLYHRAHPASLLVARAGLARRFRLRKLLGGRTRQAGRQPRRRRIVAAGGLALTDRIRLHKVET